MNDEVNPNLSQVNNNQSNEPNFELNNNLSNQGQNIQSGNNVYQQPNVNNGQQNVMSNSNSINSMEQSQNMQSGNNMYQQPNVNNGNGGQNVQNYSQPNSGQSFNSNPAPKGNVGKVVGLVLTIMVFLAMVGAGGYMYWMNKPKSIFMNSLNNTYKNFSTHLGALRDERILELSKSNVVTYDTNIGFDITDTEENPLSDLVDGLSINYNFGQDIQNKEFNLDLNSTLQGEDLINLNIYSVNDLLYLYMEDIFDKYIEIEDVDLSSYYDENDTEETIYLINKIKDLFLSSMKDEYFETNKVGISINNKTIDTKETLLTLDDKRAKEILIYILEGIKKDSRSLDAILMLDDSAGSKLTKEGLVESINDSIEEYKQPEEIINGEIRFYVYTEGLFNEVVKYDLVLKYNDEFGESSNMKLTYVTYQDIKEIIIKDGNIVISRFMIEPITNGNKYTLHLYENEYETLKLECNVVKEKTEVVIDKEFDIKTNISLIPTVEGVDMGTIEITMDTKVTVGGKVNSIDSTNVVKYSELTEEELNEIMMNIYNYYYGLMGSSYEDSMGIDDDYYFEDDYDWGDDYNFDDDYDWDYGF